MSFFKLTFSIVLAIVLSIVPHFAMSDIIIINQNVLSSVVCFDGIDNDGDGLIDYPADPGCSSAADDNETNSSGPPPPGDTAPPYVISFSPADNATEVSTTTTLSITFDNTINIQSGNILIKESGSNILFDSISITGPRVTLIAGFILSIQPISYFLPGQSYYVELPAGSVVDGAGNAFLGFSGSTSWNFSTAGDATSPIISGVTVTPATNLADIAWTTNEPALSSFFWGTTTDYATGTGTETGYSQNHASTLNGLLPHTVYYYKIETRDISGNMSFVTGSFTTTSIVDVTPPANPSGFTATAETESIALSWTNPNDGDFDVVKIMKSTSGYPMTPTEGNLVYQGDGVLAYDMGVTEGVRYYYTIFARDTSFNYSSGALASAIIFVSVPPEPEPTLIPTPTSTPTHGGGGETNILVPPPTTTPHIFPELPLPKKNGISTPASSSFRLAFSDFDFFEQNTSGIAGANAKKIIPNKNNEVTIGEKNELKIFLNAKKAPAGGVLFVVETKDEVEGKVSSYLLNKNKSGTGYETVISFSEQGKQNISIKIYDTNNSLLSEVNGFVMLSLPLYARSVEAINNFILNITPSVEIMAPVAGPIGVAIGVSQAVVLATNVGSVYDLYLLFLKFIGILTGFFRKKKAQSWGVVYDSITKQPIDPAYVVVENIGGKGKKTAITDLDGRYGFLLSPGNFVLTANKTHYKFPSEKLSGKSTDELYDNLYFGEPFAFKEDQVVEYNVPLDPLEFDWNEFAKNKGKIFSLYSRRQKIQTRIVNAFFFTGLGISLYSTFLQPTIINGVILLMYGVIIVFQSLWKQKHHITNIIDQTTKQPLSFAIISLTVPDIGFLVKKVVTDQFGRFYLLVPPGVYDMKVQAKQIDGSYLTVYEKSKVDMKKGVFDQDILVG